LGRDGDAARDRKDWCAAIARYEAYLALRPDRWPIRVQLGHAYKETGDFLAAEAAYRSAAEANPDDADIHLQFARALALSGKFEEARSAYQTSCDLEPDGPARGELENFDRQVSMCSAMDLHPDVVGLRRYPDWRSLADARAARDQREWGVAAARYQSFLDTDAGSAMAWEELAGVLAAAERHADALEAAQKALGIGPPTLTALGLKAKMLRALGRVEASASVWHELAHVTGRVEPTDDFGQPLSAAIS
jgi:tetratricopeptide (TPR) repeat protein